MPEIDLPYRLPDGSAAAIYQWSVLAVMLFPRAKDEGRRFQWLAAAHARSYVDAVGRGIAPESMAVFHSWIPHLWELRQAPRAEFSSGLGKLRRAHLAGDILHILLTCARHHPRHFRVQDAEALVTHMREEDEANASESLLSKVWADFRVVSHLWAGFARSQMPAALRGDLGNPDVLQWFAYARAYQGVAEDTGVLKPGEAWTLPAYLEVPAVDLEIMPLPRKRLAWLDREFAS